jgi:hypothetical protein
MSELQTAEDGTTYDEAPAAQPAETEVEQETTEPAESGAELAPDSPVEGAQNTDEGLHKAINKQHWKYREEQRRANELEEKLKEAEAKLQAAQPKEVSEIPPLPDSWDENYEEKIRARDLAIERKALQSRQAQEAKDREVIAQQEAQRAQEAETQKLQDGFVSNAKSLGVNTEALDAAQKTVIEYGITPEIASAIVSDSDGPLIVQHLAANPLELHNLVTGNSFEAGQKWSEIKSKAAAIKPKPSAAPAPADSLKGRAAAPKDPALDGMTFE